MATVKSSAVRGKEAVQTYDAIVVGAGPNGLVAANRLVDAGWSVLVLEQQPEVGGAVRSDDEVHPGFVHDTFSSFYPLAAASPAVQSLDLEEHGLRWRRAPAVLGHPLRDGSWALQHRDRGVTAALMEEQHPGDGEAWLDLCRRWSAMEPTMVSGLLRPFPPLRALPTAVTGLPRAGGPHFVKMLLTPAAALGRRLFGGESPRVLLAGNAGHGDIPLDATGSTVLALMLTMLGHSVGFPVPEGGAGKLTQAMAARLRAKGGEIRCDSAVLAIEVDRRRATGVRTTSSQVAARRAVLADVTAPQLFGTLVDPACLPARIRTGMRSFELDPGTVKVDWALSGPVPWATPPPYVPGTVHVSPSLAAMSEALSQVASGVVPAEPFLLAGQMTSTDPTRSPAGTESLWAYTHVPQETAQDAGDQGIRGVWDRDDRERMADRIQAQIARHAPDFESRVLARRVLGPRELEARNANLIGGAVNGGTAQLHQQLVLRPVPGAGRAETGIAGLYLASASAHPGGGVHGACGMNAARAALAHDRWRLARRH